MLDQSLTRLPGEVEPIVVGIASFEPGDDPQGLGIVIEAAEGRHDLFQHVLARMAEGRVAKVVGERQGLGKILVEAQ